MAISIDHSVATQILLEEAAAASLEDSDPTVLAWRERVDRLGQLCPRRRSATLVAALGTALLAKATHSEVDVYSLLDRGETPNSYSARSLADNVWAKNRALLGIDLGANGPNPLNNTPFIGKTHISEISGVRNSNGWTAFLDCMETARQLSSTHMTRLALRGFILSRRRSVLTPIPFEPRAGDALLPSQLTDLVTSYVQAESEEGRRAQACAAAILDTAFGPENVVVGSINDPDRRAPLDVAVRQGDEAFRLAFEVKDKPIDESSVIGSIEKTVRDHGLRTVGFLAVSRIQRQLDRDSLTRWCNQHGVRLSIFYDWGSFMDACRFHSSADGHIFEGLVFRQLLVRGQQLDVQRDSLEAIADQG